MFARCKDNCSKESKKEPESRRKREQDRIGADARYASNDGVSNLTTELLWQFSSEIGRGEAISRFPAVFLEFRVK